jgi:hypothetical protein
LRKEARNMKYETPELTVVAFEEEDVITKSYETEED